MPRPDRFRKAVVELLKAEGRPLHYTEIGRRLKEMGLWAKVREPENWTYAVLKIPDKMGLR
jgi:hypothetical protein